MNNNDERKVFIAGSRRLSKLSRDVMRRLDKIIENGLFVLVGDANGVDKAVQGYLKKKGYAKVQVFCMEGGCRNNLGNWPKRVISASDPSRRDFAYYSTKDRVMTDEADYGLMMWDGRSRGTLTSLIDLIAKRKPVAVYVGPSRSFHTLRQPSDLEHLLLRVEPSLLADVNMRLHSVAKDSSTNPGSETPFLF